MGGRRTLFFRGGTSVITPFTTITSNIKGRGKDRTMTPLNPLMNLRFGDKEVNTTLFLCPIITSRGQGIDVNV